MEVHTSISSGAPAWIASRLLGGRAGSSSDLVANSGNMVPQWFRREVAALACGETITDLADEPGLPAALGLLHIVRSVRPGSSGPQWEPIDQAIDRMPIMRLMDRFVLPPDLWDYRLLLVMGGFADEALRPNRTTVPIPTTAVRAALPERHAAIVEALWPAVPTLVLTLATGSPPDPAERALTEACLATMFSRPGKISGPILARLVRTSASSWRVPAVAARAGVRHRMVMDTLADMHTWRRQPVRTYLALPGNPDMAANLWRYLRAMAYRAFRETAIKLAGLPLPRRTFSRYQKAGLLPPHGVDTQAIRSARRAAAERRTQPCPEGCRTINQMAADIGEAMGNPRVSEGVRQYRSAVRRAVERAIDNGMPPPKRNPINNARIFDPTQQLVVRRFLSPANRGALQRWESTSPPPDDTRPLVSSVCLDILEIFAERASSCW